MPEINMWVEENCEGYHRASYRIVRSLFSGKSEFQQVDVVETVGFGRMLLNDGLVMVTERDEFVYHDMISHVPLFTHPNPQEVLVIGGGDGGTLREVIRHPGVKRCTMVEIDKMVVDACKEFIPQTSAAMSDPKADVIIDDGVKFVAETDRRFDVILIDSTDPIGPATPLFNVDFYRNVKRVLTPGGIVISQGESPFYNQKMQRTLLEIKRELFSRVHMYNYNNLTYPGGQWSFTYASDEFCPIGSFSPQRVVDSGLAFSYYNADIHRAAFCLPEFQRSRVSDLLSPLP